MVVKIRCFPATYLEALEISTSISSNRQWKKKIHLLQKTLEDDMAQIVNKFVKLKSKLQLNVL